MHHALKKLTDAQAILPLAVLRAEIARKADVCASVLDQARKLVYAGKDLPQIDRKIARVVELLDEIDETLVVLDPRSNTYSFSLIARIHRELEDVQAQLTQSRRREYTTKT